MRFFWTIAVLLLAVLPSGAWACSVCFSSTEENRWAFLITTIGLSFFPLMMVGGLVYWLHRRARTLAEYQG